MKSSLVRGSLFFTACFAGAMAQAQNQNVKIDIDAGWPARSDTVAQGFTQWAPDGDLNVATANRVATHTFPNLGPSGLTFTLTQTSPTNVDPTIYLNASWLNKNGIAGNYKLAFDGVWVHQKDDSKTLDAPYAAGGALSLTISGLASGPHTLTTYHNNVWGTKYGTMSNTTILVNGAPVTTITPSNMVTNDLNSAAAFFNVNATAGQPLVIDFVPDHTGALDNVILNGFEIDRAAAPGAIAVAPVPANGDEHVAANMDNPVAGAEGNGAVTLNWAPAQVAVTQDVYLSTDLNEVTNGTRTSPAYKGNQAASTYSAQLLNSFDTYYWRVDEVNSAGAISKGDVWVFRLRHLAFPGAEGYGRFARGGRGGRVIEVTTLDDYNPGSEPIIPGSYRAAVSATGPRTIIFRVSGLIRLKTDCPISGPNSYVTIAGQTAPGEGVCLSNYSAGIGSAHDVIMRFMRDRVGDFAQEAMDGIGMGDGTDASIIDHCTISWSVDEGTSSRSGNNITFQHNVVSEALQHSYHYAAADRTKYEEHAFAGSISGDIGSFHHNLLAHCTDRNWSLAGGLGQDNKYAGYLDIRDNVVYNWVGRTTDGGVREANYVNNYYKPNTSHSFTKWLLRLDVLNPDWGPENYFMTGNVMEGVVDETHNWDAFAYYGASDPATIQAIAQQVRVDQELYPSYVNTHTAKEAYKLVMSDVGANQPQSDVIDKRIISEVRTGTTHYEGTLSKNYPNGLAQPPGPNYPGIIDQPTDVKDAVGSPNYPWPAYLTYNIPVDSDHDGLPDYWEQTVGSNPNLADQNTDLNGDGYTALEDYLNWLASPHAITVKSTFVDIDLSTYTAGFTQPTFSVSGSSHGAVTLLADGHTARFTPAANYSGLDGFTFNAVDPDGITLSNTVGICVAPQAPAYVDSSALAPSITSATTANGAFGTAFNYAIQAQNAPTSFSATGLPTGLSVDATTGVISGSPTTVGAFTVTLGASNATGSGSATLTLTIAGQSYATWAAARGLTAANQDPSADPDGDGVPNQVEFALGLNPLKPDAQALPTGGISGDQFVFRFVHDKTGNSAYVVEQSADLLNWTPTTVSVDSSTDTTETLVAKLSLTDRKQFLRLNANGVTTVPVGYLKTTLSSGATTAFGLVLDDSTASSTLLRAAKIEALSDDTITQSAGNWSENLADPVMPWAVRLTSGAAAGKLFDVSANTQTTLSLSGANLGLLGVVAGDRFELVPQDTLNTFFGATTLQGGTSAATADVVQLRSGATWVSYYYDTTLGYWRRTSGADTYSNNTIIRSGSGLLVLRRGATFDLKVAGRVLSGVFRQAINNASTTAIDTGYPMDTTLAALSLQTLLSGWRAGFTTGTADSVGLYNGTAWTPYLFNGINWQTAAGVNSDSVSISAAAALMIQRPGSTPGTTDLVRHKAY